MIDIFSKLLLILPIKLYNCLSFSLTYLKKMKTGSTIDFGIASYNYALYLTLEILNNITCKFRNLKKYNLQ